MADISVNIQESGEGWTGKVTVSEGSSSSSHSVTIKEDYYNKLTSGDYTPEQLLETSFEFLLAREPKESILGRFGLPTISKYFPEYEKKIGQLLQKKYG
ncbi:MAG: hypothetical protein MAGBODY4_01516 [Candidatus Marinimicrobia bacterium]|nr:hypothetical protein [Candidatus Neomarinimicrobiota bacterium]